LKCCWTNYWPFELWKTHNMLFIHYRLNFVFVDTWKYHVVRLVHSVIIIIIRYNVYTCTYIGSNYEKKFKQWWSTIPPKSTKWTTTSHLKQLNTNKHHEIWLWKSILLWMRHDLNYQTIYLHPVWMGQILNKLLYIQYMYIVGKYIIDLYEL